MHIRQPIVNKGVLFCVIFCMLSFLLLGLYRLEIDTDIVGSLPENDPVISDAEYVMTHHPMQDQLFVDLSLDTHNPDILVEAGIFFENRLRESGLFKSVGLDQTGHLIPELIKYLTDNLNIMFSSRQLEEHVLPLLEKDKIADTLEKAFLQLHGIESIGRSEMFSRDPLGFASIVLAPLAHLSPTKDAFFYRGKLFSPDQKHLLVLARPEKSGTDTTFGRKLSAVLDQISQETQKLFAQKGYSISILPMGTYRAALDNETTARKDMQKAILFSTLGIAILLIFAFPRPILGLLALLPAVAGTVVAFFVYSVFFDSISLLTIGFGGAIIAISVDHGIAYMLFLDRPYESYGRQAAKEVRAVGFVAALTTVGAFFTLSISGFPILAKTGLFAGMGIAFSFLFVHWVFPYLIPVMPPAKIKKHLVLQKYVDALALRGGTYKLVIALAAGIVLLFFAKTDFDVDLRSMNTVNETTSAAENQMRNTWGDIFSKVYLLVEEHRLEMLQETGDKALLLIEEEMEQGRISSAFLPSMIFPGKSRGTNNFNAWKAFWNDHRKDQLKGELKENSIRLGFTPDAFEPFFRMLDHQSFQFQEIPESFHRMLGIFHDDQRSVWWLFSTLLPGKNYDGDVFYSKASSINNCRVFDPRLFSESLGNILSETFLKMFLIVGASVAVLLFIFLADLKLTLIALLPIVFAFICTLGTLGLTGNPLGIPALMLSVVVIGMGADYSIFFIRSYQRYQNKHHVFVGLFRMAVFLSSFSTLIGFGVLSMAEHSLLKSVGLPSFLAIGYALIGVFAILSPILNRIYPSSKKIKIPG